MASSYVIVFCLLPFLLISANGDNKSWLNHGGDLSNRRYAYGETMISPETVHNLRLKWKFVAGKDITATPAVYSGTLYFPSWNGNIYAVNASDGSLVWKKNIGEITGLSPPGVVPGVNWTVSRSTPTIANDLLIVGIYGPAVVIALKRSTGELVWSTQLDDHLAAVITMSGSYHKRSFYVGTSSLEELLSVEKCCTFRGSFLKLDANTGRILWKTFMLPDNNGSTGEYAGAAIWGSSPPIDIRRKLVFAATGNLYSAPPKVELCQAEENNQTIPTHPEECIEPDNHSESVLALDLSSGNIRWYKQLGGYDVWFNACRNLSIPNCPPGPNPDADFGEAPMMLTINVNGCTQDILAIVQKSGFAWALNRDNGSVIWSKEAGPGGISGGGTWGAATDGRKVYTNIVNDGRKLFALKPSNENTTAGGWVSMDAVSGNILWTTANPSNATCNGPVTVANGVLFAGSTSQTGPVYALNAKTGHILWSYDTGATVFGGASVSSGCVYIGNGYKVGIGSFKATFTAGTSLFAFCL